MDAQADLDISKSYMIFSSKRQSISDREFGSKMDEVGMWDIIGEEISLFTLYTLYVNSVDSD